MYRRAAIGRASKGSVLFGRKTIGLEELLWRFRHSRGLFLLGAGASAGIVPFSQSLMAAPAVDFHDGFTSLSVSPTEKDIAAQRSAAEGLTKLMERRRQPGFDEAMARAVVARMPSAYVNFHIVHTIGKARLDQRLRHLRYRNYSVFDFFPPTVLLNYNLDGIATDICGVRHRVVPVHGTVKTHLGSWDTAALVARLRDVDIGFRFDDLLLCVPEPSFGEPGRPELVRHLAPMWSFEPDFVAVCGYSFASLDPTSGLLFDDHESLRLFVERFKDYAGPVFVLNPSPAIMELSLIHI